MVLNSQNYHSREANLQYMSFSFYKMFLECGARAYAVLNGNWVNESTDAFTVGSYVHTAFEGNAEFEQFIQQNYNVIFNSKDKKYAPFVHADKMIETVRNDQFAMFVLEGQSEVIMTAEFAGALWKIKVDKYNPDAGRFADLKTVKSIRDKYWDKQYGWVSFVEKYKYTTQLALYSEIERIASGRDSWLEPLIVAVSKEDPPDKAVIGVDVERIQMELDDIKSNIGRILDMKNGFLEPSRCESCEYCRATKRITGVTHYMDLLSGV